MNDDPENATDTEFTTLAIANREVRWFRQIASTNTYLLTQAKLGAGDGLVVVADFQTSGRGRLERQWETDSGAALLCSVLFREPNRPPVHYTLGVAGAMLGALERNYDIAPEVKWPNDLMVGDRKLAGILAEAVAGNPNAIVVGIGLNLVRSNWSPTVSERAVALSDISESSVGQRQLLESFLTDLNDLPACEKRARSAMSTIGRRVRAELLNDSVVGIARRVAESGALVIETDDGALREVLTADLVHLR